MPHDKPLLIWLLEQPGFIYAVFGALLAADIGWNAWLYLQDRRRRQALAGYAAGGPVPALIEAWLNRWARRDERGKPAVVDGLVALRESPPELSPKAPASPYGFAAGLLTGLGVLGTFLGISEGLSSIDFAALENTEQFLAMARNMLGGMKTASGTSVAGLGCASFFMIVLAAGTAARQRWMDAAAHRWQELLQPPGQGGIGAAAERMAIATDALNARLEVVFTAMQSQLEAIGQMRGEQGDSMIREVVREFYDHAIKPLTQRLEESAAVTAQSAAAVSQLESSLGGISQKLAGSVEMLERFQRETHQQLQAFSGELAGTLTKFQSGTEAMLQQAGAAIREAVDESISGMARQRVAFEESAATAAETFRGIRTDLEAALRVQGEEQRRTLKQLEDSNLAVLERAEQTYDRQAEAIRTIGAEATSAMTTAREELQAGMSDIRGLMRETSQTVREELTRFREEYQQRLDDFLAQQANKLDEVLDKQRRGLQQVVEDLQTTFTDEYKRRKELAAEVDAAIRRLQEGAATLERLSEVLGLNSEARLAQLIELSREMKDHTGGLERAYRDLADQHARSLQQAESQVGKYLHEFSGHHTQALSRIDDAAARLTEGLYEAANTLVTAATARKTA